MLNFLEKRIKFTLEHVLHAIWTLQSYRHEQLLCATLRGWVNVAPFRQMLPCHLCALHFLEEDTWPKWGEGWHDPFS